MFLKISQTTSPEVENSRNERLPGRSSGLFSGTPVSATIWTNKVYHNKVPIISSTPLHSGNGFAIGDNPLPELTLTPFIDTYARCWPSWAVLVNLLNRISEGSPIAWWQQINNLYYLNGYITCYHHNSIWHNRVPFVSERSNHSEYQPYIPTGYHTYDTSLDVDVMTNVHTQEPMKVDIAILRSDMFCVLYTNACRLIFIFSR